MKIINNFIKQSLLKTFVAMGDTLSSADGSESEYSDSKPFHEYSKSPLLSPDTTSAGEKTFLKFVEPPVEKYRFRYPSEMSMHRSSMATISSLKNKKVGKRCRFPKVKLCNFTPEMLNEEVIIRCCLYTADKNEGDRVPHVHNLKRKVPGQPEEMDPIDIIAYSPDYEAEFNNMGILFIKKEKRVQELLQKKLRYLQANKVCRNSQSNPRCSYENNNLSHLEKQAKEEVSHIEEVSGLKTACLKFEAFRRDNTRGEYLPIPCPPLFSNPIRDTKFPRAKKLQICVVSADSGSCLGNTEVFIFVENVIKGDIKIRFFELNEKEEEIWYDYAEFDEKDIHHELAIRFRTPRYKDIGITDSVKVYFQLETPSSGDRSHKKEFNYIPNQDKDFVLRKRRRENSVMDVNTTVLTKAMDILEPKINVSPSLDMPRLNGTSYLNQQASDPLQLPDTIDFGLTLQDIQNIILQDQLMETKEGDNSSLQSYSTLKERLLSLSSPVSDLVLKMLKNHDAMKKYIEVNGADDETLQQINSELEEFVTDGDSSSPRDESVFLEWQMSQLTILEEKQGREPLSCQYDKINFTSDKSNLTSDKIVECVKQVFSCLINLRQSGKLNEKDMKNWLLALFSVCVDETDDCVFHVLSSKEQFTTHLLEYLSILEEYEISDEVINMQNNRKQTPLHVAADKGNLETLALLLKSGADLTIRDNKNNTPLQLAVNRKYNALAAIDIILGEISDLIVYNKEITQDSKELPVVNNYGYWKTLWKKLTFSKDL